MNLWQLIAGSLSATSDISEKRITRMVIVVTLMILTIIEFFKHDCSLRMEIFYAWLAFGGFDGYRIMKEKKDLQDSNVKAKQAEAEITKKE